LQSSDQLLQILVGASLDFIVWHEVFHHVLGHVRSFYGFGFPGLGERSSMNYSAVPNDPVRQPSSIDLRACELSADTQAILMIWRFQRLLRTHPDSRYAGLSRREMLKIVSFSVMTTFALISSGEPRLGLYELGMDSDGTHSPSVFTRSETYPHPAVRMMQVDAQLERQSKLSWFYRDRRTTLDALGIVASLGKTGILPFEIVDPILRDPKLLLHNSRQIAEHWTRISSDVEPFGLL